MNVCCVRDLPDEVLANILCFLPARSLMVNASLVCWRWYNLAQRVLSQRKKFVSRFFSFYEEWSGIEESILKFLDDIDIVPSAVVIVSYGSCLSKRFLSKLASNLPNACILIGARDTGGTIGETWSGDRDPAEPCQDCDVSVLFIPKVESVTISLFHMTRKEFKSNREQWTSRLNHLVDKNIKFMFLVGQEKYGKHMNGMWSDIIKILGGQVVAGGALVRKGFAIVEKKELTPSMVLGLVVGGNVEADTIVHSHDSYLQAGGAVGHVLQGMAINQPRPSVSQSVCFLMPCVGINWCILYKEISESRKELPNIKLFGFFGYGEIGTNSSIENNDSSDIMHYYSIVFSILKFL